MRWNVPGSLCIRRTLERSYLSADGPEFAELGVDEILDALAGLPARQRAALVLRYYEDRFADERNGWVFGIGMWATHDGGATWRPLDSPYGNVLSLEAAAGRVWAIVQSTEPHPFSAPVGSDDWQPAGSDPVPTARVADGPGEVSGTDIALQGAPATSLAPTTFGSWTRADGAGRHVRAEAVRMGPVQQAGGGP